MVQRTYGQYCGLARALELVGERWALMVVRDLLVEPKRFTDLHRGLPGIPTNILTARLKELEAAGVVQRRVLPRPAGSVVYELTAFGYELDEAVKHLARWGAKALGPGEPGEIVTPDSLIMALRTTFQEKAARNVRAGYELRAGEIVIHAKVSNGKLHVGEGPLADADMTIEAGPGMRALMAHEVTPKEAIRSGSIHVKGRTEYLERFADLFQIGPL